VKALGHRHLTTTFLPVVLVVIGSALWLWHTPPVGDLSAQQSWTQLVERSGYVPWFARWYGGVPVGGYSFVTPGLMALIGMRTVGVLATIATVVIAVFLVRRSRHPLLSAIAFTAAGLSDLYSGRITFAAGGAVAWAAVLALENRRTKTAVALAVLAGLTSPVAGVFLLIPMVVWVLTNADRRRAALICIGAILVVIAVVGVLFPVGGREPFAFFVFRPAVEIPLVAALLPVGRRIRVGLLLAALAIAASYYVTGPMGSNATRLSLLVAIPVFVAACRLPALWVLGAAVVLGIWPWHELNNDMRAARAASAQRGFTASLERRLVGDPLVRTQRVEVLDTPTHNAAAQLVAHRVTLARGWVRQMDEGRNPLFYGRSPLTAATYRSWLDRNAVAYVAMPNIARYDFGSAGEAALISGGLDYLHPVWSDESWTLYAVSNPTPLTAGVARIMDLTDTGAVLLADKPGVVTLRMRWSRWLVVDGGSVHKGPNGSDEVTVELRSAGVHHLHAVWR
jgi:hypothetical protein